MTCERKEKSRSNALLNCQWDWHIFDCSTLNASWLLVQRLTSISIIMGRQEKSRIKWILFDFKGRMLYVRSFFFSLGVKTSLILDKCSEYVSNCSSKRHLSIRYNVLFTSKLLQLLSSKRNIREKKLLSDDKSSICSHLKQWDKTILRPSLS